MPNVNLVPAALCHVVLAWSIDDHSSLHCSGLEMSGTGRSRLIPLLIFLPFVAMDLVHHPSTYHFTHPTLQPTSGLSTTGRGSVRPSSTPSVPAKLLRVSWNDHSPAIGKLPIWVSPLFQGCSAEVLHARGFKNFIHTCRSHPPLAVVVYEGLLDSMEQCREQMRFQPWDCSQSGTILHDPTILKLGYRESAYLWAMSAAGAAWGVAMACSAGWLEECKCGEPPVTDALSHARHKYSFAVDADYQLLQREPRSLDMPTDWEWSGCSDGVKYGVATSRKLLTRSGHVGYTAGAKGLLKKLEKHNLKVGRVAVKKTLIESCKCHGVSGSCQQQTCWKRAADLRSIASHLTEKYQRARLVTPSQLHKAKNSELVYTERTPDSCSQFHYDLHLRRRGSQARVCNLRNETHSQGDCPNLCCGRGHTVIHEMVSHKCNCKVMPVGAKAASMRGVFRFIWCCKLECSDCLQHKWISTCNN